MASDQGVGAVLAFLHELYPTRDIGSATLDAWALAFGGWEDDELLECARRVAAAPGRVFFPTPGEIAGARTMTPPIVNTPALLQQIERLSAYSPRAGMVAPPVFTVAEKFGEAVAKAYAAAGAGRCFANDDTTRHIAAREFQKALERFAASPDEIPQLLSSGEACKQIGQPFKQTGTEGIAAIVQRALPKGTAA